MKARWERLLTDEQGRRELLETVFVRFVVEGRVVAKAELRAPFSWLGALGQSGRAAVSGRAGISATR